MGLVGVLWIPTWFCPLISRCTVAHTQPRHSNTSHLQPPEDPPNTVLVVVQPTNHTTPTCWADRWNKPNMRHGHPQGRAEAGFPSWSPPAMAAAKELMQKGYGIGSGISLFIATNICESGPVGENHEPDRSVACSALKLMVFGRCEQPLFKWQMEVLFWEGRRRVCVVSSSCQVPVDFSDH